jgi:hypothetical protein
MTGLESGSALTPVNLGVLSLSEPSFLTGTPTSLPGSDKIVCAWDKRVTARNMESAWYLFLHC